MKKLTLCLSSAFIAACSSPNNVSRIEGPQTQIKYQTHEDYTDRFANLYKQPENYPVSCSENCYPKTKLITCEAEMENCQYTGNLPKDSLNTGFEIQWIGHASFYIKTPSGQRILVDPVSEQFDWPIDWGFRATGGIFRNQPNWAQDEFSKADIVAYSHIHYDHFNKADIDALGQSPTYYAPLNFADYFPDGGYTIKEMAWYANDSKGNTKVTFVPAHHFSARVIIPFISEDHYKTLWGGWLFEEQGKKVFFAGDTGYSEHFKDIHAKVGDIDICLMPIASYFHETDGDWYRNVHLTPEDALTASKELGCKSIVPWGYGNHSWKMGDHSSHSALFRLLHMYKQMEIDIPLYVLNEGEKVTL